MMKRIKPGNRAMLEGGRGSVPEEGQGRQGGLSEELAIFSFWSRDRTSLVKAWRVGATGYGDSKGGGPEVEWLLA